MAFTTNNPSARFEIRADDKTKAAFKSVKANMKSMTSAANLMRGAVVALGGAVAIGALVKKSLQAADAIGKMADTAGISTDMLQELRFAAELVGVKTEVLDKAVGGFNKRVGEARAGTGSLITILNKMDKQLLENLKATKTSEEAFDLVTNAAANLNNTMDKSALLAAAFGRTAGTQMALLLKGGVEGLDALRQEAQDLGLVMDESLIRQSEQANDDLTRLTSVLKTQVTVAFAELAPYVSVLAQDFTTASKEAGGFGTVVIDTAEGAAQAIAKVNDVIHGLQMTWKVAELAGAKTFEFYITKYKELAEGMVDFINLIPGVELELPPTLAESAFAAKNAVADLGIELQDLIDEGLPSERVEAFFARVREQAEKTRAMMELTRGGGGDDTTDTGAPDPKEQAKLEKLKVATAQKLEVIQQGLMSQEEVETQAFLNRLMVLEENRELELVSLQTYQSVKEGLEQQHQQKLDKIRMASLSKEQKQWESGQQGKLSVLGQVMGDMSVLMQTNSKKMFEIGKVAAISSTIVETYVGAQRAFSALAGIPVVGPALGAAAAAAAIVGGLARVQAINAQSFGGGTTAGGAAGGGTAVPTVPVDSISGLSDDFQTQTGRQAGTEVTINFGNNALFTTDQVRGLIEQINEQIEDGVNVESIRVA